MRTRGIVCLIVAALFFTSYGASAGEWGAQEHMAARDTAISFNSVAGFKGQDCYTVGGWTLINLTDEQVSLLDSGQEVEVAGDYCQTDPDKTVEVIDVKPAMKYACPRCGYQGD